MPQVFKIGKRERTVRTVLFLLHCNVCSSQKNAFFYIVIYEVLAKSKHAVISMLFL